MEYKYGMKHRGYSIGCQPMNDLVKVDDDETKKYWNILTYGRKLTEKEIKDYELEEVA